MTRANVFDSLVGVQKIIANLRTKTDSRLTLIVGRVFTFAFLFFQTSQLSSQHLPRLGSVFVLTSLRLTLHHDSGWLVRQTNRAIGFVNVLTPGSTGTVGVGANIFFVDINLDGIRNLGRDIHRRETSLPLAFAVERTDSDQSMQTGFTFQVTVRHRAANRDRGAVDPGLIVIVSIQQFDRVVVCLRPVAVHPQQHLGPVVGIGSAITRVDGHDRTVGVVGTVEQRL